MKRLRFLILGLSLLVTFGLPATAKADVNNFTITNFNSDQTLTRHDPQGELRIVETINVVFTDFNHGILRAIPKSYKNHSLQLKVNSIKSESNAPTQHTTYSSNGNTVLKIGDPNKTITGAQQYTIDYTLRNVISFYNDHAELYWDVNGDQWQQPFVKVSAKLHLPAGLKQTREAICYTGSYGSTSQNCTVSADGNTVDIATTQPLVASQTLTYVAGFESGYFTPSTWKDTFSEYAATLIKLFAPIIIIGGGSIIYWFRNGRDPKGRGVIVPQYDAPDGLKPMAVGAIEDFGLDNKAITATVIDLAVRGYIKIIETKKAKMLRKDTLEYGLELVQADITKLDPNETKLINALFDNVAVGSTVDISAKKSKLYTTAESLKKSVMAELTKAGYFTGNPLKAGGTLGLLIAVAVISVFVAGFVLGIAFVIGTIIGIAIAIVCAIFMPSRSAKGVEAKEHILGLKMYMEVAEKDRIEKLQSPDAKYAANADAPVKTVDLFEKLLPYAMVLGVEKQWAGKFESLYTAPPDWYGGNWTTFNAVLLTSHLNSGIGSAVNTAFTAPSSSGSSGFSGGGFSGGGGGGGGGGGW